MASALLISNANPSPPFTTLIMKRKVHGESPERAGDVICLDSHARKKPTGVFDAIGVVSYLATPAPPRPERQAGARPKDKKNKRSALGGHIIRTARAE